MYHPITPVARPFVLATLTACIVYDLKMAQLARVVKVDFSSFFRSDLIIQELAISLGSITEDDTIVRNVYLKFTSAALHIFLCRPARDEGVRVYVDLIKECFPKGDTLPYSPSLEEIARLSAPVFLQALEARVHLENKGTITERIKRRHAARLRANKLEGVEERAATEPPVAQPAAQPAPAVQPIPAVAHAPLPPEDDDERPEPEEPEDEGLPMAVPLPAQPAGTNLRSRLADRIRRAPNAPRRLVE